MRIQVRVTLPKHKFGDKKYNEEVARKQREVAYPRLRELFQKSVEGWQNPPDFSYKQFINSQRIAIQVYPSGRGASVYEMVSKGVSRHTITARRPGGRLGWLSGYRSATRPGTLMSGPLRRFGTFRSGYSVEHPGFEARNFPELVAQEYMREFAGDMQIAFNTTAKS